MSEPLDERLLAELASGVGGADVLGDLLRMYREALPGELDRLRAAVAEGDPEAVRQAAHAMGSAAAMFGAAPLAEICVEVEVLGETGDLAAVAASLARVESGVRDTHDALLARHC